MVDGRGPGDWRLGRRLFRDVDERSVGSPSLKHMPAAVLRYPAGAGEMGLPGATRTRGLPRRIHAQNKPDNFLPVGEVRDRVPRSS
jgi:hypothetical protein